nr:DMT family transporter [Agrobacterium fabrum]
MADTICDFAYVDCGRLFDPLYEPYHYDIAGFGVFERASHQPSMVVCCSGSRRCPDRSSAEWRDGQPSRCHGLCCRFGALRIDSHGEAVEGQSTPLADTMLPVVILVLITGALLPERFIAPTPIEWLFYVGAGALLALGRLCLTLSIRMAQSSFIAPVQYTQLFWSLLFGYLFFSAQPTLVSWMGYVLVLASGVVGMMASRKAPPER